MSLPTSTFEFVEVFCCCRLSSQAEGLIHISPGATPWVYIPDSLSSPEGAIHCPEWEPVKTSSIPHLPLVKLDVVLVQKHAVLLLS